MALWQSSSKNLMLITNRLNLGAVLFINLLYKVWVSAKILPLHPRILLTVSGLAIFFHKIQFMLYHS